MLLLAGLPAPGTANSLAHAEPAASDDDVYQLALSLFDAKVVTTHDAELWSMAHLWCICHGMLCAGVSTSSAHLGAGAWQQGCIFAVLRDILGGRKAQTVGVVPVRTLCCTPTILPSQSLAASDVSKRAVLPDCSGRSESRSLERLGRRKCSTRI